MIGVLIVATRVANSNVAFYTYTAQVGSSYPTPTFINDFGVNATMYGLPASSGHCFFALPYFKLNKNFNTAYIFFNKTAPSTIFNIHHSNAINVKVQALCYDVCFNDSYFDNSQCHLC